VGVLYHESPSHGSRSENPLNYDLDDLGLDSFCLTLPRDLHEITAVSLSTLQVEFPHIDLTPQHPGPLGPDDYIFTARNQPFTPANRRSVEEIMNDIQLAYHSDSGKESVRWTLLQNRKVVNTETRKRRNAGSER
jgi:putative membrane protein